MDNRIKARLIENCRQLYIAGGYSNVVARTKEVFRESDKLKAFLSDFNKYMEDRYVTRKK
jgi:hypothetical protein